MLRDIVRWLGELALAWVMVVCILAVALTTYFFGCDESVFRYLGGGFQLFGFLIVMYGLDNLRRLFKRPGPFRFLRDWWSRRPWRTRRLAADAGSGGPTIQGGNVRVRFGTVAGASIEQQLHALEKGYRSLFEEVQQLDKRVSEANRKNDEALAQEQVTRKNEVMQSRVEVERAIVGSHSWEWAGVIVFIAGTVASNFAAELACFSTGLPLCGS